MPDPKVLYEDGLPLAVDKPPQVHSAMLEASDCERDDSIAAWLMHHVPCSQQVSKNPYDAGLINRLDFETSGILLAAKSHASWLVLRKLLLSGGMQKSYIAIVEGHLPLKIEVENFIGTPNRRAHKVKVYRSQPQKRARALPAKSEFRRMAYSDRFDASLARMSAGSARRHQLRAHASFLGHPMLGDSLYNSARSLRELMPQTEPTRTFFLHCEQIYFKNPLTGTGVKLYSPQPAWLNHLFGLANQ